MLGKTAYTIGELELAEAYLVKLLDRKRIQWRMTELSLLADIWYRQGKHHEAEDLLVTCVVNLTREIATCKYRIDLERFQEERRQHVDVFSRLFPDQLAKLPELVLPSHRLS